MSSLKIYIDNNYPKRLIEALEIIHRLQSEKQFELIRWEDDNIDSTELDSSVFLLVDYNKKGMDIPTMKHFEAGYRVIACKAGSVAKLDYFEMAMTVLRVWPFIIERATQVKEPFLYSFRYGGRKLSNAI